MLIPRPLWFDAFFAVLFALLMVWVGFDMYATHGLIPGLLFPAFFGAATLVIICILRQPLEVLLLLLIWLLAAVGLISGFFDGVTWFPSKNSSLSISRENEPVWFAISMAINGIICSVGVYFAMRWAAARPRSH